MILTDDGGRQAVLHCALDTAGSNRAVVLGTTGAIEIDRVWYTPTAFTRYDRDWNAVERYSVPVATRGMHFQALEMERRVRGEAPSSLPIAETVAIMGILDEVRTIIGLEYPGE